jgi:hypothetical protein
VDKYVDEVVTTDAARAIDENPKNERSMAAARRALALLEPCGAKTRAGTPCKRPPNRGSKRCRLHGSARGSGRPPTSGKWTTERLENLERIRLLLTLMRWVHGRTAGRLIYNTRGAVPADLERIVARIRELETNQRQREANAVRQSRRNTG